MILIVVKWTVLPESAPRWPELTREFTEATRAEDGCLFFEWSRSVDDERVYTLVEAFRDDAAGAAHVGSDHFRKAVGWMGDHVERTPEIINVTVDQDGWGEMGEVTPTRR